MTFIYRDLCEIENSLLKNLNTLIFVLISDALSIAALVNTIDSSLWAVKKSSLELTITGLETCSVIYTTSNSEIYKNNFQHRVNSF